MTQLKLNARVGADGVLRLTVPVGMQEADREVQITVEPVSAKKAMTPSEWAAWVDSKAGRWQGEFERPPQGAYEERDPF